MTIVAGPANASGTVYLAPLAIQRFYDNNNQPLNGGLLYTYQAGTTIPQATYTDATGGTANANPIVLNSRGECSLWLLSGQLYKLVLQDSAGNTIWTQDNVAGISATNYIWCGTATGTANAITLSPSPSIAAYVAGQTFSFLVLANNTGPTTVSISGLGVKNVTHSNGAALVSGDLVAGTIAFVIYDGTQFQVVAGLVGATGATLSGNNAFTGNNTHSGTEAFSNTVTLTAALNEAAEVSVASGATTYIGAAASNNVYVTGSATINAFDNVPAGITRHLRFAAGITLAYNATSMILQGSTNITTAANDTAIAHSLGGGNWQLEFFPVGLTVHSQLFTSSGTFVAPLTGTYAVTIKGGGGGGGGAGGWGASGNGGGGGGGGEGQLVVGNQSWTAGQSVAITVGGAGSAGSSPGNNNSANGTGGGGGGTTTVGSLSAAGGGGGGAGLSAGNGGTGGGGGFAGSRDGTAGAGGSGAAGWGGGYGAGAGGIGGNGNSASYTQPAAGTAGYVLIQW